MCNILRCVYKLIFRKKDNSYLDELEPFIENKEDGYFSDEESYNEHLKNNIIKSDMDDGELMLDNEYYDCNS